MTKVIDALRLAGAVDSAYKKLEESKDYIEIPALKEGERSMKRRIHNAGQDSGGNIIGVKGKRRGLYSPGYARFKARIANPLYPINLQLYGDLLRGYTVGKLGDRNVLQFQDEFSKKKAAWAETNYKTEIFRHSEQELEDIKEVWLLQFEDVMKDAFGNL
jgi:hypothetical protein